MDTPATGEPNAQAAADAESVKPTIDAAEAARAEVSASTLARMMGVATASELKLLEGKMDLLATKLNLVVAKIERAVTMMSSIPTGSDLERIDVQIGALRSLIKDSMAQLGAAEAPAKPSAKEKDMKIVTNANTAEAAE